MKVGVPREIKPQEYRVGLTPMAVREYVSAGHEVIVQTGAGEGIGAADAAYVAAGHSVWGILNAPASGEALAELIVDGASRRVDLTPFNPARLMAA